MEVNETIKKFKREEQRAENIAKKKNACTIAVFKYVEKYPTER